MPKTITDPDTGEEVEVFTQEEVEVRAKELGESLTADERERLEQEKEAAILEKEEKLVEAQEKLKKLEDKDYNFKQVARGAKAKEEEENALKETMANLRKEVDEVRKAPMDEAKNSFIADHLEGNKELHDKFDVFMDKLGKDAKNVTELKSAMEQAYMLANDGKKPDTTTQIQRTGINDNFADLPDGAESQDSKDIGASLGLSAEDKKKYGSGKVKLI